MSNNQESYTLDDINKRQADIWRTRLKQCMEEQGLTQLAFVGALNRQYLTRYHQKDVSRWLNTGNRTASGVIGFPKYETMMMIADFFGVDVGYLTGETDERTFDMGKACDYTGLSGASVTAIRRWIAYGPNTDTDADANVDADTNTDIAAPDDEATLRYRTDTLNELLSSPRFPELAAKLMTLHEMSTIWKDSPDRFESLMSSLASGSDLSSRFTFELITGAFYGMASESFSRLVREAYPAGDVH